MKTDTETKAESIILIKTDTETQTHTKKQTEKSKLHKLFGIVSNTPPCLPEDRGWFFLGVVAAQPFTPFLTILAKRWPFVASLPLIIALAHCYALARGYLNGRDIPYRVMGRHAKCQFYLISICSAILLRVYLNYRDLSLIYMLVSYTVYLQSLVRLRYNILDLRMEDAILGAVTQFLLYQSAGGDINGFVAVLIFSGVITLHQYFSYTMPDK